MIVCFFLGRYVLFVSGLVWSIVVVKFVVRMEYLSYLLVFYVFLDVWNLVFMFVFLMFIGILF